MKRPGLVVLFVVLAIAVVALTFGFGQKLLAEPSLPKCDGHAPGPVHSVVFQNSKLSTIHVQAKLCDRISFTNRDTIQRLVAFGPHEHHTPYDGVTEQLLAKNQSLTIILNQAGTFHFHDHLHDELAGTFTVTKTR